MTNFLVIVVYEILAKPLVGAIAKFYEDYFSCKLSWWDLKVISNFNQENCPFNFFHVPSWLFSSIPWANENLLITLFSLAVTWFLIWFIFICAKWLYRHEDIKKIFQKKWKIYTSEFWALLLLTFILFSILICILYPLFWFIIALFTIRAIREWKMKTEDKTES